MAVDDNRLLLINPYQTYLKSLESEYQSYIPYGLTCIAAICGLRKMGWRIVLYTIYTIN